MLTYHDRTYTVFLRPLHLLQCAGIQVSMGNGAAWGAAKIILQKNAVFHRAVLHCVRYIYRKGQFVGAIEFHEDFASSGGHIIIRYEAQFFIRPHESRFVETVTDMSTTRALSFSVIVCFVFIVRSAKFSVISVRLQNRSDATIHDYPLAIDI